MSEKLKFNQIMNQIDEISNKLGSNIDLEDSINLYKQAEKLIEEAETKLVEVRKIVAKESIKQ
ncbi:exodeoxyribonuclease VII small subunit [Mycoplasmopsis fermentans]|nr:exodeoxyribonuclease VII small subunit [Mycoplasmopsis fermentans]ADN68795.1 putative Exonuclease VII small subunit [Mycoplasmopsis fermentans JER]ADV34215.1 Exodeoxyribonuclease VII, small subunit [Mycoplasmopsis fermentans M64]VEU60242.1 Exonuclease VII small subunit [Mycoplasmopsis fermentans]VEU67708.1 Exonuclease VII small subunit [Mesomycoplasma conjunctivae]